MPIQFNNGQPMFHVLGTQQPATMPRNRQEGAAALRDGVNNSASILRTYRNPNSKLGHFFSRIADSLDSAAPPQPAPVAEQAAQQGASMVADTPLPVAGGGDDVAAVDAASNGVHELIGQAFNVISQQPADVQNTLMGRVVDSLAQAGHFGGDSAATILAHVAVEGAPEDAVASELAKALSALHR